MNEDKTEEEEQEDVIMSIMILSNEALISMPDSTVVRPPLTSSSGHRQRVTGVHYAEQTPICCYGQTHGTAAREKESQHASGAAAHK